MDDKDSKKETIETIETTPVDETSEKLEDEGKKEVLEFLDPTQEPENINIGFDKTQNPEDPGNKPVLEEEKIKKIEKTNSDEKPEEIEGEGESEKVKEILVIFENFSLLKEELLCHIARFLPHQDLLSFFLVKKSIPPMLEKHQFYEKKCFDFNIKMLSIKEQFIHSLQSDSTHCPECKGSFQYGINDEQFFAYAGWWCSFCKSRKQKHVKRFVCRKCSIDKCENCEILLRKCIKNSITKCCSKCTGKLRLSCQVGMSYLWGFSCEKCKKSHSGTVYRYQCTNGSCGVTNICLKCMANDD